MPASSNPLRPLGPDRSAEYEAIERLLTDSAHGRWFLTECARRHRQAETAALSAALDRLESLMETPGNEPAYHLAPSNSRPPIQPSVDRLPAPGTLPASMPQQGASGFPPPAAMPAPPRPGSNALVVRQPAGAVQGSGDWDRFGASDQFRFNDEIEKPAGAAALSAAPAKVPRGRAPAERKAMSETELVRVSGKISSYLNKHHPDYLRKPTVYRIARTG
jgi:hypothetical protein